MQATFSAKLKGLEDDFSPNVKQETIPAMHKIAHLGEDAMNVMISSFPKAPTLFSVTVGKDGRNFLSETQFFDWISNLTTKHVRQGIVLLRPHSLFPAYSQSLYYLPRSLSL